MNDHKKSTDHLASAFKTNKHENQVPTTRLSK
jgi:hypothetical protein